MTLTPPNFTPHIVKPDIALIAEGMYSVLTETQTLGFVYKVGRVFVALKGSDFGRAVEVGQTLSWNQAVEIVRTA